MYVTSEMQLVDINLKMNQAEKLFWLFWCYIKLVPIMLYNSS